MRGSLICSICLVFVSLLFAAHEAAAQQVKLRLSLQGPVANPLYGASASRFKEEVERRSKGSLLIEIFDKAQLFTDSQIVGAVSSGAVDIGTTASQNFVGKAPALAILDLPFLFNFKALMNAAASPGSEIRTLIDEAILAQAGMRVLWWQAMGDTVFLSKGGRDVADVEQFKDQKVAVPGKALEGFVKRCGGSPTALSVEKFQSAIGAGTLDMAIMTVPGMQSLGLWKVMDTITYTAHAPLEFIFVINEKAWQSLSPAHRAIMTEAARAVEIQARKRVELIEAAAARFVLEKGVKTFPLTPDQVAEWRACSAEMISEYMDRNGELARRLMNAYAKLRTDPCCTKGPSETAFTRR